jgi:alpha-galactosidase
MALRLLIHGLQVVSTAEDYHTTDAGLLLKGRDISLELPMPAVRCYLHGWQSWSLTTWLEAGRILPPSFPERLHAMQTDPLYARHSAPHSAWVGAVEFADGKILLLGALALEAHVEYRDATIYGWYEGGDEDWLAAYGTEGEVFAAYSDALAKRFGSRRGGPAPRVWCSWYSHYTHIDQLSLARDLEGLRGLPFEVFQIDDGWQRDIGDWEPNAKFPAGMDGFAREIRGAGFRPGLWLAPLIVLPTSRLYKEHRDWLLRDKHGKPVSAGHNWAKPVYALDPSLPAVLEWLAALMKKVRGWGYDYVKLDFLYAGALPGDHHAETPRETALRLALQTIRENLGEAYLLACGAPILPAIGLCDGIRIGPDVAEQWLDRLQAETLHNFAGPGMQNALRTSLSRLWLKPLIHTDPDVVYFRSLAAGLTADQKTMLRDLAWIAGFRATSDPPGWLTAAEREQLVEFLRADPSILQLDRYRYKLNGREVDFAPHIGLPPETAFKSTFIKRILQRGSNSDGVLALAHRYERYRSKRRLRKQ